MCQRYNVEGAGEALQRGSLCKRKSYVRKVPEGHVREKEVGLPSHVTKLLNLFSESNAELKAIAGGSGVSVSICTTPRLCGLDLVQGR